MFCWNAVARAASICATACRYVSRSARETTGGSRSPSESRPSRMRGRGGIPMAGIGNLRVVSVSGLRVSFGSLRESFGIVSWKVSELRHRDAETQRFFTGTTHAVSRSVVPAKNLCVSASLWRGSLTLPEPSAAKAPGAQAKVSTRARTLQISASRSPLYFTP